MEKKIFYAAPTVELQEIVVEQGFAASPESVMVSDLEWGGEHDAME